MVLFVVIVVVAKVCEIPPFWWFEFVLYFTCFELSTYYLTYSYFEKEANEQLRPHFLSYQAYFSNTYQGL